MIAVAPSSPGLTFEVGAAETMTFRDEFDLVVSFNALHWVRAQREALSRIAAALHSGGRAVLVFVCGGERPSVEDVAMAVSSSPRWSPSFVGFTAPFVHPDPEQWQADAESVGLSVTRPAGRRPVVGLRLPRRVRRVVRGRVRRMDGRTGGPRRAPRS